MNLQVVLQPEQLSADLALMRFLSSMEIRMPFHLTSGLKSLIANQAGQTKVPTRIPAVTFLVVVPGKHIDKLSVTWLAQKITQVVIHSALVVPHGCRVLKDHLALHAPEFQNPLSFLEFLLGPWP